MLNKRVYQAIQPEREQINDTITFFWFEERRALFLSQKNIYNFHQCAAGRMRSRYIHRAKKKRKEKFQTIKTSIESKCSVRACQHYNGNVDHFFFFSVFVQCYLFFLHTVGIEIIRLMYISWLHALRSMPNTSFLFARSHKPSAYSREKKKGFFHCCFFLSSLYFPLHPFLSLILLSMLVYFTSVRSDELYLFIFIWSNVMYTIHGMRLLKMVAVEKSNKSYFFLPCCMKYTIETAQTIVRSHQNSRNKDEEEKKIRAKTSESTNLWRFIFSCLMCHTPFYLLYN